MNIPLIFSARRVCAALFFLLCAGALAADAPLKLEAQLVVGSNDPQIHGTPVSPQIEKKLKRLPLKWGNYYILRTERFSLAKGEDKRLVLGSLVFGMGWGLAGFCPGPAVVSLAAGQPKAAVFVVAMLAGMAMFALAERWLRAPRD